MNQYINVYNNNPVAGGTNGTLVSTGDMSNAITFTLNASNNEVGVAIPLALRTEAGYTTSGNTVLSLVGTNNLKWQLSADNVTWSDWGQPLTISSAITNNNKLFYVKSKATSDEAVQNDTTVKLHVSALISAV